MYNPQLCNDKKGLIPQKEHAELINVNFYQVIDD